MLAMYLINGSRDHPNHQIIMWHECDIYYGSSSVTIGYVIAASSSESLLNDCEKPNQSKKLLFLKYDLIWLNFLEACIQISTQQKWYSLIYTGRMVVLGKLLDSLSINPVLSTIKLLKPRNGV